MDFSFLGLVEIPLLISLKVSVLATASSLVIALLAAWGLARKRGPIPALLDSICTLPLVLPPTVLGYYLILLVGRRGLIGSALAEAGINLIFSWQGAVVAATVVVYPLIYKSARAALESVDSRLEDAARTLGSLLAHTGCIFSGNHTIVILNPPSLDFRLSFFRISSLSLA